MAINIELGHTWCYPDYNWQWLTKIPEKVALEWIRQAVPTGKVAGYCAVGIEEVIEGRYQWLNKLAIIVDNEDRVIALYKHDFACWIIQLIERTEW